MQELQFSYSSDGLAHFDLALTSEGDRITNSDIVMMGNYIHLLFLTIRRIGVVTENTSCDVDEMIRNLMNHDDKK